MEEFRKDVNAILYVKSFKSIQEINRNYKLTTIYSSKLETNQNSQTFELQLQSNYQTRKRGLCQNLARFRPTYRLLDLSVVIFTHG